MTVFFNVIKVFLIKSINQIINQAENKKNLPYSTLFFNTTLLQFKRDKLEELKNAISKLHYLPTDHQTEQVLTKLLTQYTDMLLKHCKNLEYKPGTTENGLAALNQLISSVKKKLYEQYGENITYNTNDPLSQFIFYSASYNAHILFDERNAFFHHNAEIVKTTEGFINQIVLDYKTFASQQNIAETIQSLTWKITQVTQKAAQLPDFIFFENHFQAYMKKAQVALHHLKLKIDEQPCFPKSVSSASMRTCSF